MKRALIIGAGISGLATALRLQRDGWRTLVVERAPARRSSGYMVNLLGPGYDAADTLGLLPALRSKAVGVFTTVLVHADGRPKFTVPAAVAEAAVGPRLLTVFRGDLEAALFDAVNTEFRFATTVKTIDQNPDLVRVELSDGTTEDADLVVGADGVHSQTRTAVFGDDFRVDFPYVVAAFGLKDAPEGSATTYIGPGRTAATVNLGPERSSAFFTYRCADPGAELAMGPAEALRSSFGDVAFAWPEKGIPDDVYFDKVSQVVMPRWSNGRVVLIGDAAWCVTLFAGHGAALALAGADQLGDALQRHDTIPEALTAWEATLRPTVVKRQAAAQRGMLQFAPPTRFHVWLSEVTMRAITLPGIRTLVRRAIERQNQ
ncbi:2-polyprenyl-6-methoxyphenol hydroxylase-like FAD-dependent oxidoreductase [Actinoplanes lutulentus]|uniref:2-polyprenyl-6-methoxyphenol hydroxylase-like FAD-dependent oxidoreductase n=1 Tax=Actinoplanes lutulentus TaxID=1287878 RepID=A0A327Z5A7_9ACTN|nr:FAD-dependent oxidoreductase [Actinoplanes lutulentus]MBB2949065.1 2-polyprenyl-6-methoxyphenol hydroxylase-like FAD-dependent oxidoreductase [Actinoplanes lutulentus]RAK31387.1 2-polyprenyl-6-methoxyphenol hydroxylase-like FAD-dependent oxidoreductase [Actinoplanes lutulentus]